MRRLVVAVVLLSVACQAADVVPPLPPIVLETPDAWRGSEITLQSAAFLDDTLPEVHLGGVVAPVRYLGGERIAVRLPDSAATFSVSIWFRDGRVGVADPVTSGGALVSRGQGLQLQGPMAWPQRHGGQVVAGVGDNVKLVRLADPGVATSLPIPDSLAVSWCLTSGPGPSFTNGFVTGARIGPYCGTVAWSYDPAGQLVMRDSSSFGVESAVHVGSGAWVSWFSHAYYRIRPNSHLLLQAVEGAHATLSPRGDLVAPSDGQVDPALGIPVFAAESAAVVYRLAGRLIGGSDFSVGGDTLFIGLGSSQGVFTIVAANATTGAILGSSDSIPSSDRATLQAEPSRPWLYFMVLDSALRPSVFVLDRRTMQIAARLRIPDAEWTQPPLHQWWFLFLDAGSRKLYLYDTRSGAEYVFSLLP